MQRPRTSDSNLFAIDHDAIKSTLADANAPLLKRRDDLLAACSRAPERLESDEDVTRARRFAGQLDEAIEEARKARLSDGRPFRDASATVKSFFDEIEKPLQSASRTILKRLTDTAHRGRRYQAEPPMPEPPTAVGIDVSGEAIVTSMPQQTTHSADAHPEIRLVWSIQGFDRSTLNLEALRDFLTDASILAACRKHLAVHGPHKLQGVEYEEVAQPN
jgi:hypothetical protein